MADRDIAAGWDEADYRAFFARQVSFDPYDFQVNVARHLLAGRSVILQAPTGAGKTEAALFPYLYAQAKGTAFPRRLLYVVPMRVLAKAFDTRARRYAPAGLRCAVQTGDQPEAPSFAADMVFATIDQVLSSFLLVPYSLSRRQGNLNAGALCASYLVFDEFHLLDPDASLPTTLVTLGLLKGLTPSLLMTATFSDVLLHRLADLLDAAVVRLAPEEAGVLSSQRKTRRLHCAAEPLTAQTVLDRHLHRSIVVCNTVERAQKLFSDLRQLIGDLAVDKRPEVVLLHARFYAPDRRALERRVTNEDRTGLFDRGRQANAILVATQVIEVGLDITCDTLHTELAPMSAILQRAGRCARYEGETGDVYVYPVESLAPYSDLRAICDLTWQALAEVSGHVVDVGSEHELIYRAHAEHDRRTLEALAAQSSAHWQRVKETQDHQELGNLKRLIRIDDSRRIFIHENPSAELNPYEIETFSLYRGSLIGQWETWVREGVTLSLPGVLKYAVECDDEGENERRLPRFEWKTVQTKADLESHVVFAVHPAVAAYDAFLGFRFATGGHAERSPLLRARSQHKDASNYRRETYSEHVTLVLQALDALFVRELAWPAARFEEQLGLPKGAVARAARFIVACHDAGKLTRAWQAWAHAYQAAIGEPVPDDVLLAHTHYDGSNPAHRSASDSLKARRPPHAAEGVAIVAGCAQALLGDQRLARAAVSAIARHHAPSTAEVCGELDLDPYAHVVLAKALAQAGFQADAATLPRPIPVKQLRFLAMAGEPAAFLLYLLLVRALRLADQAAMKIGW